MEVRKAKQAVDKHENETNDDERPRPRRFALKEVKVLKKFTITDTVSTADWGDVDNLVFGGCLSKAWRKGRKAQRRL